MVISTSFTKVGLHRVLFLLKAADRGSHQNTVHLFFSEKMVIEYCVHCAQKKYFSPFCRKDQADVWNQVPVGTA